MNQQQIEQDSKNRTVTLKVDELLLNHLRDAKIGDSDLNEVAVESPTINQATAYNITSDSLQAKIQADRSGNESRPQVADDS